jgi:hypothetical protein
LQLGRPFEHLDARVAREGQAWYLVRLVDLDALSAEHAEARARQTAKLRLEAAARLPHGVALAGNAVERLERAQHPPLAERVVLPRRQRDDAPGNRLAVQRTGGVEELLDQRGDGRRHDVDALAHAEERAARGVLCDGADVIEVPVAHQHQRLADGRAGAPTEVEQQPQRRYLDARLDAGDADAQ